MRDERAAQMSNLYFFHFLAPCKGLHIPLADSGEPATTGFRLRFVNFLPLDSSNSITFSATPDGGKLRNEMTFSRSFAV